MTNLLQYRQPLPTTLLTAGIVAFAIWVMANYITGTDYLWFRVTSVFALVLLTPAVLESVAAAITNSPDDRNLRLLYGALVAYIFCLFPIIAFFGYIQYASAFSKLLLVAVALGVGIYAGRKTPDIPTDIVEIYKPVKNADRNGFVWFYLYYILPPLLMAEIYIALITTPFPDATAFAIKSIKVTWIILLLSIPLGLFPVASKHSRKTGTFTGKQLDQNEEFSAYIILLIVLINVAL